MKDKEALGARITEAFLSTTSAGGLTVNLIMIAVLPALAEELLFRGVLAKLFRDWTRSNHLAVMISAFVFAAIHLQFYGFLPRFLLGVALGYLFFWSGSLWLPIAAHFTNNFLSVMVEFLFRKGLIPTNAENFGFTTSAWLTGFSFITVVLILYLIFRLARKGKPD
jgi:membrane protease YdiL (CAAX protease family)